MGLAALVVMAVLAAAEAPAQPTTPNADAPQTPTPAPLKPAKPDDSQKVVCEETPTMGSFIPRRVCHTKAEWRARSEHDQEELRRLNETRNTGHE